MAMLQIPRGALTLISFNHGKNSETMAQVSGVQILASDQSISLLKQSSRHIQVKRFHV